MINQEVFQKNAVKLNQAKAAAHAAEEAVDRALTARARAWTALEAVKSEFYRYIESEAKHP